jgi:hypothetical protein
MEEEIKLDSITSFEDLKKNIESILRDIKNLLNLQLAGKNVEVYADEKIILLREYGLLDHSDVGDVVSLLKLMIQSKEKIDSLSNELLQCMNQSLLFEKLSIKEKQLEKKILLGENIKNDNENTRQPEQIEEV